jgi:hypothetical protein
MKLRERNNMSWVTATSISILAGGGIGLLILSLLFFLEDRKKQIRHFKVGDKIAPRPTIGEFTINRPSYYFLVKAVGKTAYLTRFVSTKYDIVINENCELSRNYVDSSYERVET